MWGYSEKAVYKLGSGLSLDTGLAGVLILTSQPLIQLWQINVFYLSGLVDAIFCVAVWTKTIYTVHDQL